MKRLHLLFTSYFLRSAFFEPVSVMGLTVFHTAWRSQVVSRGASIVVGVCYGGAQPSFSWGEEEHDISASQVRHSTSPLPANEFGCNIV